MVGGPRGGTRRRDGEAAVTADRAVYIISVAAELAGVHPQTLRVYERRGLLEPDRTPGGSRRYSERDIERLRRIQELTAEGMSLGAVERFLQLEEQLDGVRREADELRRRLVEAEDRHRRTVAEVHRSYRRDLVPLRQEMVLYRRSR